MLMQKGPKMSRKGFNKTIVQQESLEKFVFFPRKKYKYDESWKANQSIFLFFVLELIKGNKLQKSGHQCTCYLHISRQIHSSKQTLQKVF